MSCDCLPLHYGDREWPCFATRLPHYYEKVLSYGPIAYWPLWEGSGTVAECLVDPLQNGGYIGVTLASAGTPLGTWAPLFDGINDYVDIGNATFRAAFQTAAEAGAFSILIWAKVSGVGVWTDTVERELIRILVDASNFAFLRKSAANNTAEDYYVGGGTADVVTNAPYSNADWFCSIMTVDRIADEQRGYCDGVQVGATQVGLGVWAGIPSAFYTSIGNTDNVIPQFMWSGYLAHCVIFDYALSLEQVEDLSIA